MCIFYTTKINPIHTFHYIEHGIQSIRFFGKNFVTPAHYNRICRRPMPSSLPELQFRLTTTRFFPSQSGNNNVVEIATIEVQTHSHPPIKICCCRPFQLRVVVRASSSPMSNTFIGLFATSSLQIWPCCVDWASLDVQGFSLFCSSWLFPLQSLLTSLLSLVRLTRPYILIMSMCISLFLSQMTLFMRFEHHTLNFGLRVKGMLIILVKTCLLLVSLRLLVG